MGKRRKRAPGAGRPKQHLAGFARTTITMPLDLLSEVDTLSASWIVTSGRVLKRSELMRAALRAVIDAERAGRLPGLATCRSEEAIAELLRRKLSR